MRIRTVPRGVLVLWIVFVVCVAIHAGLERSWLLLVGAIGALVSMAVSLSGNFDGGSQR